MFKRILVPLDGSTLAEQALVPAARIAHATGGSVLLVRVVSSLQEFGMYTPGITPYLPDILDEDLSRATAYLAQMAVSLPLSGIDTRIAVFSGPIASTLLDVVRDERIDLVVMSSHGYTGFKRWMVGSIARKIVHHCPVPVFLLRKHVQQLTSPSRHVPHPIKALVALDGSPFAEAALRPAVDLVAALSTPATGELSLMQLVKMPTVAEEMACEYLSLESDLRQAALRREGEYLQTVRERLCHEVAGTNVTISWAVEECSDVADTLINLAERGKGIGPHSPCDLIVMATHGRGGVQCWLMGSITERVLEHSSLPMLIVRPTELAAKVPNPSLEGDLQCVGLD